MILEKLWVRDFRQYYGGQNVEFAPPGARNVTVIHGDNGAGKTALLNAISWCLYGILDLEDPEKLLNERRAAEMPAKSIANMGARLYFSEGKKHFIASRFASYLKVDNYTVERLGKAEFAVRWSDDRGQNTEVKDADAEVLVNQIVPRRMRTYFFFDGERIDQLAKVEHANEITEAIRNVMGLEALERAIRLLGQVKNIFQSELKKVGSVETQGLIERIDQSQGEISRLENEKGKAQRALEASLDEKNAIDDRLRGTEAVKHLQQSRDQAQRDLRANADQAKEIREQLRSEIGRLGAVAFLPKVAANALDLLETSRQKGQIPSGIKDQFVEDLLESGECICGRELSPGTAEFARVGEWRERAGNALLEESASQTAGFLKQWMTERPRVYDDIRTLLQRRQGNVSQHEILEGRLKQISQDIKQHNVEEIQKLEERRRYLESEVTVLNRKIWTCEQDIKGATKDIRDLEETIAKQQQEQAQAELARKRAEVTRMAGDTVSAIYELAQTRVRDEIAERVNGVFKNFFRKDYYIDITDDYQLRVFKTGAANLTAVAMSQGERQIASLAFIGGLVALAREWMAQRSNRLFGGGVYPIVMDSPFGTLDEEYRRNVASGLPHMASQVVVLSSGTQWKQEVEESMRSKVGAEYTVVNMGKYPEYSTIEEGYRANETAAEG